MRQGTGGNNQHQELWDTTLEHCARVANHTASRGDKTAVERLGGKPVDIHDEFHPPLCRVDYLIKREYRSDKWEDKSSIAVWVGRTEQIPGGHVILPITFDKKTQRYDIGKPHVTDKGARITPTEFTLCKLPEKWPDGYASTVDIDLFVDQFNPNTIESDVMLVQKLIGKRFIDGQPEYKVKWVGWPTAQATWEPRANLEEYGSAELMAKYDRVAADEVVMFTLVEVNKDSVEAVRRHMRRHGLKCQLEEWVEAYDGELDAVIHKRKRMVELFGPKKEKVLKYKRMAHMRMNPEHRKPTLEHPDGRKKLRLLIRGDTEPIEWVTMKTDSPVASANTVRMMVFSSEQSGGEQETISTCDADTAFLQSHQYDEDGMDRYLTIKEHKDAVRRVFKQLGSFYGQRDASARWFQTLIPCLLELGFVQGSNDKCVFRHPGTAIRIALHVDDFLVRGVRSYVDEFYADLAKTFDLKPPRFIEDGPLEFVGMRITATVEDGVR